MVRSATWITRARWTFCAPEEGTYEGQKLAEIERLGQVVVGPRVETTDAIFHAVARGRHQDRDRPPARAPGRANLPAVLPWQHQIEDDQAILPLQRLLQTGGSVPRDINGEAGLFPVHPDQLRDHLIIFDHQYVHADLQGHSA